MALGDKKSEDIFNKNTGGDKDGKTITSAKETEIKNRFDDGEHIEDTGMFENLAPALYAIQKVSEDVEELRRYLTQDVRDSNDIYTPIVCNMLSANLTTPLFVPFSDGITEGASSTNPRNVFVAPCSGLIHKIVVSSQNSVLEKGRGVPMVATFSKRTNGASSIAAFASCTMTTASANTAFEGTFAVGSIKNGTKAFAKGDQLLVSLDLTDDKPTGSKNYYVTVIFKLDQSNLD
tara:strand:+ start:328 stop:1029 length:702 start_codon:yes stop_codon:yes gene_type:complete